MATTSTGPSGPAEAATRRHRHPRRVAAATSLGLALSTALIGGLPASGDVVEGPQTRLDAVGPTDPENGYPVWYRDSNGIYAGLCLDPDNPFCNFAAGDIPDPAQPVSFPDNFPGESFYTLSEASIDLPGGGEALVIGALEAAFNTEEAAVGENVVFGRVRIRIDVPSTGTYTVTHPYGVDTFDVEAPGERAINFTEDIGIGAPGDFTGALNSRINPFLMWSATPGGPATPVTGPDNAQYLGDPTVPHAVTGSALGTNFFRIEGPNIGGPGDNMVETSLFTLMGKITEEGGAAPGEARYTRTGAEGGFVDVFTTTRPGQTLQVSGERMATTTLEGDGGRYFARVPFTGEPPTTATITNTSDSPPTPVNIAVTVHVNITSAVYDADADTLTVTTESSDAITPPALDAESFGPLTGGTATFAGVTVPPATVTVTVPLGASDTEDVTVAGAGSTGDTVVADAGAPQTVQQGQTVLLTAAESPNATYAWTQAAENDPQVVLTGADTRTATFTAPSVPGTYGFTVTVNGPGGPLTDTTTVTVGDVAPAVANAGPDQQVLQGSVVMLDGSGSQNVTTYSWAQTAGAPVANVAGADTAAPTFTMPATTEPLVFELTASGPAGNVATDTVEITPVQDAVTGEAQFRSRKGEWRVSGTSSVTTSNIVTVQLGRTGQTVGTTVVDAAGGWQLRVRDSNVVAQAGDTLVITTTRGGSAEIPIEVRR